MGRFIAVLLFVALLFPAVFVGRVWSHAGVRRQVSNGALSLTVPTIEAERAMKVQAQRARLWRLAGLALAVILSVAALVMFAESAVFLWPGLLVGGLVAGVLFGELTRVGPPWETRAPARRPQSEFVDRALPTIGRLAALGLLAVGGLAMDRTWAHEYWIAAGIGVVSWLIVEATLERLARRVTPSGAEDIPVDDALRINSAHVAVGAGSVLNLLILAGLLLVSGVRAGDSASGSELAPVALIAGAFGALVAALVISGFLIRWLAPVRWAEAAWGTAKRG
ncbi:MAG: hypothetical protein H0U15_13555 [Geodermatophilaceae bacterium]|jgi:hypothetical protein|nr:hypothetical protein [Geodermatophilaceae bacterium]